VDTQTLIASLEAAPGIIIGLIREVPPQNLKRRPAPNKWSAHEHACHLSIGQDIFLSRLEVPVYRAGRWLGTSSVHDREACALFGVMA